VGSLVVLIEDDPLARFGLALLLKDWGYSVVAESSLEAAKAALDGTTAEIAAIVADFYLGEGKTGVDAALELAKRAGGAIPTMILSGDFGMSSAGATARHDFEMLAKPVDPERLKGWLASAIKPPP